MRSVVHIVTTANFAGVERYVATTATATAARGLDVTVVGGAPVAMRAALGPDVRFLPGATAPEALRSLARLGRQSVCHAHMTIAEAVAVSARPFHRAPIVSTRHFAAARGATPAGSRAARWIEPRLTREIAISTFVAAGMERPPAAIVHNGVPLSPPLWSVESRTVLVLQRLEAEKDTLTALRAWGASQLEREGWTLRVVGDGSERAELERTVASEQIAGVRFAGWTDDVAAEFARAGILLASAAREPFGLAVVEAMAAGVPVVACDGGAHRETIGMLPDAPLFAPGDSAAAGAALRSLLSDARRTALSRAGREIVESHFTIEEHVDRLLVEYDLALVDRAGRGAGAEELRSLVVCSLEPWDEVWRRNQFFVDTLLARNPRLRILFVEPPTDPIFDLAERRRPRPPRLRSLRPDRRLITLRPLKPLPRKLGESSDRALRAQVRAAARALGLRTPTLWINDVTYAPLIASTGWPSLYDVTDDWLLAPFSPRELERLTRLDGIALQDADEVVVCSPALAASRGAGREVQLITNAVDSAHFRRPRPRPDDLPPGPVAVYVGTLHEARLDVDLVLDLARAIPELTVMLIGPDGLDPDARALLAGRGNIRLAGPRPYLEVPGYLQHADVIVVPHRISPFTESLDPIKAYECLALDTPTVATPVASFRDHPEAFCLAEPEGFAARVAEVIAAPPSLAGRVDPPEWAEQAAAFESALLRAGASRLGRR